MKKILRNIIILTGLIIGVNVLLNHMLPTAWGNEVIYKKTKTMDFYSDQINTIFLGTSRIHGHVMPELFDNTTKNTFSFNLGCPGSIGLETYGIIHSMLKSNKYELLKYIYIEIPSYAPPPKKNEDSVRANYFFGLNSYLLSLKYTAFSDYEFHDKILKSLHATKMCCQSILGLGYLKTKINVLINELKPAKAQIKSKRRGFSPINKKIKQSGPISARKQIALNFYENKNLISNLKENTFLTKTLLSLVELAESKGVEICFVFMPKNPENQYETKMPSWRKLAPKNKLNFSNPTKYPALYNITNSADKAHLNIKGARRVTELMAKHHNKYFNNN